MEEFTEGEKDDGGTDSKPTGGLGPGVDHCL